MNDRQLTLDFEEITARETVADFTDERTEPKVRVLSKQDFMKRTRELWLAIEAWIIDCTPATEFSAFVHGVYETAEPESLGTFSDIELVRSLSDEWELVTGLAIATEEAAKVSTRPYAFQERNRVVQWKPWMGWN
ncbi:hypothetical protein N9N28_03640 [Rubripirellula amarantea]|nr:hypothetical protein [Rubripirellula amarantea]